MGIHIKMASAIFFYAVYLVGMVIFAISPLLHIDSKLLAAVFGFLFCAIAYGGYGLTPLKILDGWFIWLTWRDLVWGIMVVLAAAITGFYISRVLAGAY